jgi:hypothetical protein
MAYKLEYLPSAAPRHGPYVRLEEVSVQHGKYLVDIYGFAQVAVHAGLVRVRSAPFAAEFRRGRELNGHGDRERGALVQYRAHADIPAQQADDAL